MFGEQRRADSISRKTSDGRSMVTPPGAPDAAELATAKVSPLAEINVDIVELNMEIPLTVEEEQYPGFPARIRRRYLVHRQIAGRCRGPPIRAQSQRGQS